MRLCTIFVFVVNLTARAANDQVQILRCRNNYQACGHFLRYPKQACADILRVCGQVNSGESDQVPLDSDGLIYVFTYGWV